MRVVTSGAPDLLRHYNVDADEDERLRRSAHGRLEFLRTQELLRRFLPAPPARIIDVGGGTGVHARWLAADGYRVSLVDVVPAHVERAGGIPGVEASLGDARDLAEADRSVEAVLLLGPLYHLRERENRVRALVEARRVVRPGGVVAAAAISRYLGLLEAGGQGRLDDRVATSVRRTLRDGYYDGALGFVPAYFHTAAGLAGELRTAGFGEVAVYGVEGPAWPALDAVDLDRAEALLADAARCARIVETDSAMIAVSAHLLAIAPVPDSSPVAAGRRARSGPRRVGL